MSSSVDIAVIDDARMTHSLLTRRYEKTAEFIERAARDIACIVVLPEPCRWGDIFESRAVALACMDRKTTTPSAHSAQL
jgi:hypothetical protein